MPEMIVLMNVNEYVGEEVDGSVSECVVDGQESSKVVEGCRLETVLSSITSFVVRALRLSPMPATPWQLSDYDADTSRS